jgi:DNA-binding NtrC family response regulator
MHKAADPHNGLTLDPQDEDLAERSAARLLITDSTHGGVEAIARRIHAGSVRAALPLVQIQARDFPLKPWTLRSTCSHLLDAAAGGSVLIRDVEEMPLIVQALLVELLAEIEVAHAPSARVRLMSGTTVSLRNRVAAGTFSERLFYRLNIIHLMAGNGTSLPR